MIHQCTANSVGNPNPLGNNNNEQQQKKKKRRNKKKKANKVIEENSSDSDSDLEDLAFIAPPSVAINKGKPKPSLGTYHENQLGNILLYFLLI